MARSAPKNFQISGEPKKFADACSNQEMRQAEFFWWFEYGLRTKLLIEWSNRTRYSLSLTMMKSESLKLLVAATLCKLYLWDVQFIYCSCRQILRFLKNLFLNSQIFRKKKCGKTSYWKCFNWLFFQMTKNKTLNLFLNCHKR